MNEKLINLVKKISFEIKKKKSSIKKKKKKKKKKKNILK